MYIDHFKFPEWTKCVRTLYFEFDEMEFILEGFIMLTGVLSLIAVLLVGTVCNCKVHCNNDRLGI